MKKVTSTKKSLYRGYTLAEVAVALAVLGFFIAATLSLFDIYMRHKQNQDTVNRIQIISESMQGFLIQNGRYPCPASISTPENTKEFGHELNCEDSSHLMQGCRNGLCLVKGERIISEINQPLTEEEIRQIPIKTNVRIGAVPVRTLGLDTKYAQDGFGSRFLYAVTENMAIKARRKYPGGAITIKNEYGERISKGRGNASFVIISHGRDKDGAFNGDGGRAERSCYRMGRASRLTTENCDYNDAVFVQAPQNSHYRAHYDDVVYFSFNFAEPKWRSLYNKKGDLYNKNTSLSTVSVGGVSLGEDLKRKLEVQEQEQSGYKGEILSGLDAGLDGQTITEEELPRVEVHGDTKIEEKTSMNQICNSYLEDCFYPKVLGGEGMACPKKYQYMTGIQNSEAKCSDQVVCDSGQYMYALDKKQGLPLCAELPTFCSSEKISVCGKLYTLPSVNQFKHYVIKAGFSTVQTFDCRIGNWIKMSEQGSCDCKEKTVRYEESCPSGLEGKQYGTRKLVCSSESKGEWKDYGIDKKECKCKEKKQILDFPCTEGYAGKLVKERTFLCPSAIWGNWRIKKDLCSRAFD